MLLVLQSVHSPFIHGFMFIECALVVFEWLSCPLSVHLCSLTVLSCSLSVLCVRDYCEQGTDKEKAKKKDEAEKEKGYTVSTLTKVLSLKVYH